MEFEKAFSRPGKVMDFRKMAEVMEFHFWPRSFVLFANWKHFPCHRAKICPNEKAEFSAFLNHGHRKVLE